MSKILEFGFIKNTKEKEENVVWLTFKGRFQGVQYYGVCVSGYFLWDEREVRVVQRAQIMQFQVEIAYL